MCRTYFSVPFSLFIVLLWGSCIEGNTQSPNTTLINPAPCLDYSYAEEPFCSIPELITTFKIKNDAFTCTIDTSYRKGRDLFTIGLIKENFRMDEKVDTILFQQNGADKWPILGATYLIIASKDEEGVYRLSGNHSSPPNHLFQIDSEFGGKEADLGNEIIKMTRYFFKLRKDKHSGPVTLELCGQKVATGTLLDGKLEGIWQYYFYNKIARENLKSILSFGNDLLDGACTLYKFNEKGRYHYGTSFYKSGRSVLWLDDKDSFDKEDIGAVEQEESFWNGNLKDTKTKIFSPSGELIQEEIYRTFPTLYGNHKIKHGAFYKLEINDNRKVTIGQYFKDIKVGKWTYKNDSGEEWEEMFNFPDTTVADVVLYLQNGEPSLTGRIVDGKKQGVWKRYKGKEVSEEVNFKDGIRHGKFNNYYISSIHKSYNGEIYLTVNYVNGKKEGIEKKYRYDQKSTLETTTEYKDGKKHGEEISIRIKDGIRRVEKREHYKYGRKDGKSMEYIFRLNGTMDVSQHYKDGLQHGPYIKYIRKEGEIPYFSGNYWYGLKEGVWEYDMNFQPYTIKHTLEQDETTGEWKSFKGEKVNGN